MPAFDHASRYNDVFLMLNIKFDMYVNHESKSILLFDLISTFFYKWICKIWSGKKWYRVVSFLVSYLKCYEDGWYWLMGEQY